MHLHPDLLPPRTPFLTIVDLKDEHQIHGPGIQRHLFDMHKECLNIAAAVALFSFCKSQGDIRRTLFVDWMFIAARDGAMSIRNFAVILSTIRAQIGKIPDWLNAVDVKALKEAEAVFSEAFPFAHKLRHSVAHPEFYSDSNKKMGVDGAYIGQGFNIEGTNTNTTIKGSLHGDTFHATFEGQVIHYDVTPATASAVNKVTSDSFAAFSKLERFAQALASRS